MSSFPEVVPEVSFDINLRHHVDSIDFDYQAFDSLAKASNFSGADIGKYKVEFKAEQRRRWPLLFGRHSFMSRRSQIYVRPILERAIVTDRPLDVTVPETIQDHSQAVNSVFIHETGHYAHRLTFRGKAMLAALRGYAFGNGMAAVGLTAFGLATGNAEMVGLTLSGEIAQLGALGYIMEGKDSRDLPLEKPAYDYQAVNAAYRVVDLVAKQPANGALVIMAPQASSL